MKLIRLVHSDPRFLVAPVELPYKISFLDLANFRYGKLLIAEVGGVIADYVSDGKGNWVMADAKKENK
jgi:hypothetical protein